MLKECVSVTLGSGSAVSQACSAILHAVPLTSCRAAEFWQDLLARTRPGCGSGASHSQLVAISQWMRECEMELFRKLSARLFTDWCYSCHGISVADIVKCAGSASSSVGLSLLWQEDEWQWEWHRESWWRPSAQPGGGPGSGIPATQPRVQGATAEEDWESPAAKQSPQYGAGYL